VDVLKTEGTVLDVQYGPAEDEARLQLWMERSAARAGAGLVGEAVHRARLHHARHVLMALDASLPSCGLVLDVLRGQMGGDVENLSMRRAGSSVMVDVELRP
jgi:hypothetical protein